jgi:hypothetical protein
VLLVFGAEYLWHFMPEQPISDAGGAFLVALLDTGYMFPLIKAIEVLSGALLLAGIAVPMAVALFAPIALNIALYHMVLDSNGITVAAVLGVLEAYLLWSHRGVFRRLLATGAASRASTPVEASGWSHGLWDRVG